MPGILREKVIAGAKKYGPRYSSPLLPKQYPPYTAAALAYKYEPSAEHLEILKGMVALLKKVADNDYTIPVNGTMDQFDKKWRIPNMTVGSLVYWNTLPYALETLRKAGVTEKECFNYKYQWRDLESRTEVLPNSRFVKPPYTQYKYYTISLRRKLFQDWGLETNLTPADARRYRLAVKRMRFYEDGKLIGPGAFLHRDIINNGYPGWSCRGGSVMMNSSDNSDPRTNGRKYIFTYTSEKDWKWEDKPSFNEKLVKFFPFRDKKMPWCASLVNESPDELLVPDGSAAVKAAVDAALKRHTFTENGKVLKTWKRNQNLIIFQTSDGSDPRTNGREYRLIYKNKNDAGK